MNIPEWFERYNSLNKSFDKRMVFRLGVDSGYFSEYNNMILAMLFCLKHRIRFEMYSDHAHFALRDGWNDFFKPVAFTNHHRINKDYCVRPYIIQLSKEPELQKIIKYRYMVAAYKSLFNVNYLMQDLWDFHRDPEFALTTITAPELNFEKTPLLEAAKLLIAALWQYNAEAGPIVESFVKSVSLPEEYISIHVRAGDKFTETKMYDFNQYMSQATRFPSSQTAFVMTDDYTVIEQLREQYPTWQFHTLCTATERGYFHTKFVKQDNQAKYLHHLRLFAELDIAAGCTKFIGTYSSNIGMYMGMRIGPERCQCIDFDNWVLW
jgi:hypothetical protein